MVVGRCAQTIGTRSHLQVQAIQSSLEGTVGTTPIADYNPVKAPVDF